VGDVVVARIPTGALYPLSDTPGVTVIRTPVRTRTSGHVLTEGIETMDVSALHERGINGSGVGVAIVDHSFDASNPEIADQVVETKNFTSTSFKEDPNAHGTAVAEIVAEVAPEANLHLYQAVTTTEIEAAAAHVNATDEVDVVVMSLGVDVGPFDGSSTFDDWIGRSVDDGQNWFVAAGNSGQTHYGGAWTDPDGDGYHNFSATDSNLSVSPSQSTVAFTVNWDDWGAGGTGGSDQDYDVAVVDGTGTPVETSVTRQDGEAGDYPVEQITVTGAEEYSELHLVINRASATGDASFDVFVTGATIVDGHRTPRGSLTRPATEEKVDTVGAVYWDDASLRAYSSRGPTDGGVRKPEFVAPDGTSSTVYGAAGGESAGFTGTSAAAPHAGGVAALLLEADGTLAPPEVTTTLATTTDPVQGDEPNNRTGDGLINATAAVDAVVAASERGDVTAPSVSGAGAFDLTDGDGEVAGGDTVRLNVTAADDTGVHTVEADAAAFGAGTVVLQDGDGDDVYDATFTVGSEGSLASDGARPITFVATDSSDNRNTTTASLVIDTSGGGGGDTTPPTVSNFGAQTNRTRPLGVSRVTRIRPG
jgi:subtilisin family serine protease